MRCRSPIRWTCVNALRHTLKASHSRRAAAAHFSVSPSFVINLMTALRERGGLAPKPLGGRRHAKLEPQRDYLLRRIEEKDDITMPELAAELLAQSGMKADPASLSHWFIRNGLSFKKKASRRAECDRPDVRRAREEWVAERQPKMRLEPQRLVFIDETGTTTKMTCARGRVAKGERLSLQGPLWPLEDPDLRRWTALRGVDRALARRRPDGPRDLRELRAHPTRPYAAKGRHRESWTICPRTKAPPPNRPFASEAPGCCFCRPTAPTSIPSKWPLPNSRRISAPGPRAPSTNSGKPSDKSATSSQTQNAKTTSRPQDMDLTECPML